MPKPQPLPGVTDDGTRTRQGRKGRNRNAGAGAGDDGGGGSDSRDSRLNQLLEQFGGGAYRLLAERTSGDGSPEYLGPVPFNVDLYESVRERWGGGLFSGRIVDERSHYKARIQPFRIGGPPKHPGAEPTTSSGAALPPGLESALAGINRTLELLANAQRQPAVDPVEQVTKIARALRDVGGASSAAAVDPLETMRNMWGFMNELRETSGGTHQESDFGTVVREGVGPLVRVLERKLDIDEQRERRRGLLPGKAVATQQPAAQRQQVEETQTMPTDELRALLLTIPVPARRFLLGCAENGDDADDYVPLLLNRLSDDAYAAMSRLLPREDFLNVLIETVPAYAPYREWFSSLVDALRETVAAAAAEAGGQDQQPAQGVEVPA